MHSIDTNATVVTPVVVEKFSEHRNEEFGRKAWSTWSECSESCEGGLEIRVRQCEDKHHCDINSFEMEERICNEQDCVLGQNISEKRLKGFNEEEHLSIYSERKPTRLRVYALGRDAR